MLSHGRSARGGGLNNTITSHAQAFLTAFNDRDTTFGQGLNIGGVNYEVHRFYDEEGMIYGRTHSVDPQEGEGVALVRQPDSKGAFVFALVTYRFPILSAKAVPELQAFLKQWGAMPACTPAFGVRAPVPARA